MYESHSTPILCLALTPCLQRTLFFNPLCWGQVNRTARVIETASGKGVNVARVLHVLGGNERLLCPVGGTTGERFTVLLEEEGLTGTLVPSAAPTRICQTLIDEKAGQVTELVEEAAPVTSEVQAALRKQLVTDLQEACCLVISGSPPPDTNPTIYRDLIQLAQGRNCRVILDTQKQPLLEALDANPWMVKLNQEELGLTLARDITNAEETVDAARVLLERGIQNVVVTQGADRVWLINEEGVRTCQPPPIKPVNPIGSGDAMAAGIALGVSKGESLAESLRLGIACGAANALTQTSGVVQPGAVLRLQPKVGKMEELCH